MNRVLQPRRLTLGAALKAALRRFRRARDGAAAVEFGLVIGPFMAVIMVILEASYLFITRETLDNALAAASRQILTGQAQTSTGANQIKDQQSFINYALCPNIGWVVDCTKLQVNVQPYTTGSFSSVTFQSPVTSPGNGQPNQMNTSSWSYSACQAGSATSVIMKVEVAYPVGALTSYFTYANTAVVNGVTSRVLYSSLVFRCEPF